MNYLNLTPEQKGWIAEMQKSAARNRRNFVYVPSVICDTETGEVYRTAENNVFRGYEIIERIGSIPRKAIPHKRGGILGKRICKIRNVSSFVIDGNPI